MTTIGYIRVSSDEQAHKGISLEAQRAKITAWAAMHDREAPQIIEDAGYSAKSLERPGAERLLEMIRTKQVHTVVIAKLDRLTRSIRDLCDLVDLCRSSNCDIVSIAETIDSQTAAGRMIVNILGVIAQWERETIAERTSTALQHLKANGRRAGNIPYGFSSGPDKRLVPCPEEQRIIDAIRAYRAAGLTYREIAARLNADGYRTRRGGKWLHQYVGNVLDA